MKGSIPADAVLGEVAAVEGEDGVDALAPGEVDRGVVEFVILLILPLHNSARFGIKG